MSIESCLSAILVLTQGHFSNIFIDVLHCLLSCLTLLFLSLMFLQDFSPQ